MMEFLKVGSTQEQSGELILSAGNIKEIYKQAT